MSTEEVTRRSHKTIVSKAQRWSAPAREKGFSPAVSTPDQITRDVRGLKLRQRVSIILGDEILREELEEVVGNVDFTSKTTSLQSVRTYQDFLLPTGLGGVLGGGRAPSFAVTPIADIRGMDTIKFSKEERLLRCKVASVYRLAEDFGWTCSEDQVLCTVSAMECGLLPISNEAVAVGDVNYYTLCGIDFSKEDKEDISRKCEGIDKVLFLRNIGAICIGKSVEETFYIAYLLTQACLFQIHAMRAGIENLTHIDKELRNKIYQSVHEGDDANQNKRKNANILFEAWMRRLDAKGHKTGYDYSVEVFKREPKPVPPKVTKARTPAKSSSFHFPQDKERNPVRRAHTTGRGYNRTKLRWLNEPVKSTEYKKEPSLESSNIEDVIVKDRHPERPDKDTLKDVITEETIGIKEQVTAESAPPPTSVEGTADATVTTVVTVVETQEGSKEKRDRSSDSLDDSKLLSPGESGRASKKRKK
ncbi:hypothetical protein QZH41_009062, partial [Actinostola sp. cb2023]